MTLQAEYQYILLITFIHRLLWILNWTIVLVAGLLLVFYRSKRNPSPGAGRKWKRARDYQRREDKTYISLAMAYVGLLLMAIIWVIPPIKDYLSNSVVQVEAIYYRDKTDHHKKAPNIGGTVYLTVNGETFSVELYPGYSDTVFPEGTFSATVWYAESSKILLDLEIH